MRTWVLAICAAVSVGMASFKAAAVSVTFDYEIGADDVLQAVFTDTPSGKVSMTISVLQTGNTIGALYFNLNPALSPAGLVFNQTSLVGGTFANFSFQTGTDQFKVDGGGKYDIKFMFPDNAVVAGDAISFMVLGATAGDFNFLSTATAGGVPTQSSAMLSANGAPFVVLDDVTVRDTVPDASATVLLLGLGITGVEGLRRKFGKAG